MMATTPLAAAAVSLFGAPLGSTAPLAQAAGTAPAGVGAVAAPAPFADLLTEAVGQVEQYETQAKAAIEGLMSGRGVDVHEVMIASQKAGMGFELMLSVRNKALAAYQQVMGLQF
jgi:flagellar hook-basal body complex protein FliE